MAGVLVSPGWPLGSWGSRPVDRTPACPRPLGFLRTALGPGLNCVPELWLLDCVPRRLTASPLMGQALPDCPRAQRGALDLKQGAAGQQAAFALDRRTHSGGTHGKSQRVWRQGRVHVAAGSHPFWSLGGTLLLGPLLGWQFSLPCTGLHRFSVCTSVNGLHLNEGTRCVLRPVLSHPHVLLQHTCLTSPTCRPGPVSSTGHPDINTIVSAYSKEHGYHHS